MKGNKMKDLTDTECVEKSYHEIFVDKFFNTEEGHLSESLEECRKVSSFLIWLLKDIKENDESGQKEKVSTQ